MAVLGIVATAVFAAKLGDAPFVDEYAYISQSYYTDLYFSGRWNDPAWLEFPAYDLVPLPKYLIGVTLHVARERLPGPEAARAWYAGYNTYGPPRVLTISRIPFVLLGAVGCVALAVIGWLAFDFRAGVLAGFILMLNPLYALHAHRAMTEAPCEAFLLTALALALAAWNRALIMNPGRWAMWGLPAAGVATALSILSKFNGLLAIMTIAAWAGMAWMIPRGDRYGWLRFAVGSLVAVVVAWFVFLALNPFMTARNPAPNNAEAQRLAEMSVGGRFRFLIQHRRAMSAGQQQNFPHNALRSIRERVKVAAVQGFGRFGPFGPTKSDSTIRYDRVQDWGAFVWLPIALIGLGYSAAMGRVQFRRREAPAAWAVGLWALIALTVVTLYLPMAWDRYLLPIQAPFALLGATVIVAAWDALGWLVGLKPRVEPS
ncbi:4-amino-4-deoxy-L-arabinose transferase [Paludisphaera rhizosphaerae]|uniref:4-amino-4-deoxy-L-arabinose transferase n=1 Tax=Paludisphaera rhizosphaerae TaxID=2711216 RepID=UPI001C6EC2FA|nr:4-amino-4-deoxy-L-arabinose transferase [Paludisphaera rhizosphaerae]